MCLVLVSTPYSLFLEGPIAAGASAQVDEAITFTDSNGPAGIARVYQAWFQV